MKIAIFLKYITGNCVKDRDIKEGFSIKTTNCNYVYTEKT